MYPNVFSEDFINHQDIKDMLIKNLIPNWFPVLAVAPWEEIIVDWDNLCDPGTESGYIMAVLMWMMQHEEPVNLLPPHKKLLNLLKVTCPKRDGSIITKRGQDLVKKALNKSSPYKLSLLLQVHLGYLLHAHKIGFLQWIISEIPKKSWAIILSQIESHKMAEVLRNLL